MNKMSSITWLPETIQNIINMDFETLKNEIYPYYLPLFNTPPFFKGLQISTNHNEYYNNNCKHYIHLITKTALANEIIVYENRALDRKRSCRVHWISAILNNIDDENVIYYEKLSRGGRDRNINIILSKEHYAIFLKATGNTFHLKSAYKLNHRQVSYHNANYREYRRQGNPI